MNPGKTLLLLQFLLCAATAAAQSAEVRIRIADQTTREAVVGAVAELRSRTDAARRTNSSLPWRVSRHRATVGHSRFALSQSARPSVA